MADVLQLDFTRDGTKDHSMIVTKKTTTEIYLTYHTSDMINRPLSDIVRAWEGKAWFYAYRT